MPLPRLPAVLASALLLAAGAGRADIARDVDDQLRRGDPPAALALVDAALSARPRDAQARFLRGLVLMEMRRDEPAQALFTQLHQEYPELPEPLNNLALLHARAGRLEEARMALESALRNDPGHRLARLNLAEVHLMLAVRSWELAAASAPLDARTRARLQAARDLSAAGAAAPR